MNTIDRGYSIGVGATAGVCSLLRLDSEQTRHAMSMALTSGLLLRAARAGALSDYKGVASSVSAQFAVFAALLARGGLTGPSSPVSGRHGLVELLTGKEGELPIEPFSEWKILQTCQKYWPVAYGMQPGVWAAVELGEKFDVDDVRAVTLHVAPFAWFESGSEEDKWDPQTRETADHSLPYAFARAFQHGALDQDAFQPSAFRDAKTLDFMKRVEVKPDPGLGPQVSDVVGVRAELIGNDGSRHQVIIDRPRGHHANPMTRDEISQKARRLIEPTYGDSTEDLIETIWETRSLGSFDSVMEGFIP
jgi:2-methylcitrate dehydratase